MAEAIVTDLAAGLVRKVVSLATNEVIQVWNLNEDLETLREKFELIGALLHDAHAQNLIMSTAKMWFNKLEEVAHVAEAFMDELEYEVTRRKVENCSKVRDFFIPSKNTLIYRSTVAHKIKYINTSIDKICKWATDIGLKPVEHLRSMAQHRVIRHTPPFEDESLIVGRDNDISFLVNMLCDKNDEDLPVNAILGMGGQGKTTLARMVYNKDVVIDMFSKRMWVTVSDDFDFMKILNQMVVSLTSRPSLLENAEGIVKDLQEKLKGKKFLLVLDDVWNEKPEEWEKLRNSLLGVGGARGSTILVTTRRQKVTDAMRCSHPYRVEKLSEEDSWELFKRRAFSNGGVLESEEFVILGRTMVKRCGGLPLAIKALGGLLYSIKTEQEWLRIQNSEIWKSAGVLSSLRLSYDYLPCSALRRCFAYCSIIPKDSYICKDELVQIWMALGFLPGDSNALMEDVGNEYFDILSWNSLLQDVEKDEYGNIDRCKMHDLVHDLALDVSSNYSATVKTSRDFKKVSNALHVRLEGFEDLKQDIQKAHFDTVQALYAEVNLYNVMKPNLKHLRVLVLQSLCQKLPSSIGNLKYLKHLDISCPPYCMPTFKLPNYITILYNLQTLKISDYHELPEKFCHLINLRHLIVSDCGTTHTFNGIERLTCLQTLPHFVASRDQNFLVGQLGGLKNLRGTLRLYSLMEVENIEEARKAKLREKSNIEHLLLCWRNTKYGTRDREDNNEDVMKGLEAHPNLKELTIDGFLGKKLASWITVMTNLVKITMRFCQRCEVFPPLGHLPKLRKMHIQGMDNVKVIGNDFCGGLDHGAPKALATTLYQSLTELHLSDFPELEEWLEALTSTGGNGQDVFPKLDSLSIWECPRLRKIPNSSFRSLTKLSLCNLLELEEWVEAAVIGTGGNGHSVFPRLEDLYIDSCPRLKKISNSCFPSLRELKMDNMDSNMIVETMSRNVTSLTFLGLQNISDGGDVSSCSSKMDSIINVLLEFFFDSLRKLSLIDCKGLEHLNLGASIDSLSVHHCPHLTRINFVKGPAYLKSLSIGELPSSALDPAFGQIQSPTLVELSIGPFTDGLDEFTWPFSSSNISFPNLITLRLTGWEKVKSVPLFEQLQFSTLPALTRLDVLKFQGIKVLLHSIAKLPSLNKLSIANCKNLASLPMFDESHCLECLEISGCPILQEKYSKGSGREWFKIKHIPKIRIY